MPPSPVPSHPKPQLSPKKFYKNFNVKSNDNVGNLGRRDSTLWKNSFVQKPKELQNAFIHCPWVFPMTAHNLGAIQIQKYMRGILARNKYHGYSNPRKESPRCKKRRRSSQLMKYMEWVQSNDGIDDGGFSEWCAVRITSWWRMISVNRKFKYRSIRYYTIAAMQIQHLWRSVYQRKMIELATLEREKAATEIIERESKERKAALMISDAWRRYTSFRIYNYYKNLIKFRLNVDPQMLLRTINPNESSYFDEAIGIHVRFRLGGKSFPPVIYYKVFCHSPLCDVNSFAPRDYANLGGDKKGYIDPYVRWNHNKKFDRKVKIVPGRIRVGKSSFETEMKDPVCQEDTKNWYRREENNGWRAVTMNILLDAEHSFEDEQKKKNISPPTNFCNIKRKEEIILKRKERKRNWMMKMYRDGLAKEKTFIPDSTTGAKDSKVSYFDYNHSNQELLSDNLKSLYTSVDFDKDTWETDANKLLNWTSGLDYDGYVENWQYLATSAPSGKFYRHLMKQIEKENITEAEE